MPIIETETLIHAPRDRVFDLSRSIDLHVDSAAHTDERAIAGTTAGLIEMNQDVTWRARHFGVWQNLTSRITAFDRPNHFRDSMVSGAFSRFDHDHYFDSDSEERTIMKDVFSFDSPFGLLGKIANQAFLTRYMRRFLEKRNQIIKSTAESDDWHRYL